MGHADGAPGAFGGATVVVSDGLGRLYVSDTSNCTIRSVVISTGQVSTLAGRAGACSAANSSDGTGATARFNQPAGLAISGSNLYVADAANSTIRTVNITTGATTTLAGLAESASHGNEAIDAGSGSGARFNAPGSLVVSGNTLYVSDGAAVRTVNTASGATSTLAGSVYTSGSADGTGGLGGAARFNRITGLAISGSNLYVADYGNRTIRAVNITTGTTTTLAGTAGSYGNTNGTGATARFGRPNGLVISGSTLYLTDADYNTIRTVNVTTGATATNATLANNLNPIGSLAISGSNLYVSAYSSINTVDIVTGMTTTLAGSRASSGVIDGAGSSAQFAYTVGLAISGGNLYVADSGNHTIRAVDVATSVVTTLAGLAHNQGSGNGTGALARFNGPQGLAISDNTLFVADMGNSIIRKIDVTTGITTTLAGTAGSYGSADGTGSAARFSYPYGLAISGSNLYVTSGNTIRKIDVTTGITTTLAGLAGSSGSTDGTGSAARFDWPRYLAISGNKLYVTDYNRNTIRVVDTTTGATTTLAGLAGSSGSADGTGSAARFSNPQGLAISGSALYVAAGDTVRKIDVNTGAVSTVLGQVGQRGAQFGNAPGVLNQPVGLAIANGKLYITMQNGIVQAAPLP